MLVRLLGRQAFLVLALVPAASFGWILTRLGAVTDGGDVRETVPWVPPLDLSISLRLDALSLTLAALVTGVGALVLRLLRPLLRRRRRRASAASPATLTAFAGAMLGLVLADDLLLLYVFWELTTVFSYLLIGGTATRRPRPGGRPSRR